MKLLWSIILLSTTGSALSMLPELPPMKDCKKLTFLIDSKHSIKTYNIKGIMQVPVHNIQGQNLLELSPIKGSPIEDHVRQAYLQSTSIRAILKVENKEFLSKVSPVVVGCGYPYRLVTLKALDNL